MSPETTYISVEGDNPRFQPRLCTLNVSGPPCPLRSRELPVSVPGSPLTPASLDIRGLSVHHCDHLPVILKAVTPSTLGLGGGRCTGPGEHGHSDACARMPVPSRCPSSRTQPRAHEGGNRLPSGQRRSDQLTASEVRPRSERAAPRPHAHTSRVSPRNAGADLPSRRRSATGVGPQVRALSRSSASDGGGRYQPS